MSGGGPTRVLFRTLDEALRTWLRETRSQRRDRSPRRRRVAAAAAVTLAAGMTAGPAVAAVDPSGDNQNATNVAADGTQVAMRGARPGPQPPVRLPRQVPREQSPPQQQQPIPPQRPKPGPLDRANQEQVERGENLRSGAGAMYRKKAWDRTQGELAAELDRQRRDRSALREEAPPTTPYDPDSPLAPPLTQEQVDAINEQSDDMEQPGYVNQYPDFSLAPESDLTRELSRDMDKANVDREISRSYLDDPVNAPHNKDMLDEFRKDLHDAIDTIHDARTEQEKQAARDRYNEIARDFNAAELGERDNYGGHAPGNRVVPNHLSDHPVNDDQTAPVGAMEQGLPPERMSSPRSLAQDDPDFDGPPGSRTDSPQMDSPRSRAQHDPDFDGPATGAQDNSGPGSSTSGDSDATTGDSDSDTDGPGTGTSATEAGSGDSDGVGGSESTSGSDGADGVGGSGSVSSTAGSDSSGSDSSSFGGDSGFGGGGGSSSGGTGSGGVGSSGANSGSGGVGGDSSTGSSGMDGDSGSGSSGGDGGGSGGVGASGAGSGGADAGGMGASGVGSGGMGAGGMGASGVGSSGMGGDSSGVA